MASYVGGCLLLFTLMSTLVVLMSQLYKANLEFDNKMSIVKPIYIKHADSLAMCASFCGFGCKCFNFNLQTGMCQPYNSCNALYMTVDERGWRLYIDQTLNTNDSAEARVFQHRCIYESYIYHEENVTKNQYCFIKSSFNWKNAKETCQSFRSQLLEINTESEQIWLNDKVYGDSWWTGGVRDENGTDWVWNNSISKMVYTNWDTAQPNNYAGEDCVTITSLGRWHDYNCTTEFYIICEMGQ